MKHERFNYHSLADLRSDCIARNIDLSFSEDTSILKKPVKIGLRESPNAFAVLPMEGCDSLPDGSVSDAVRRRYLRFAEGGSGLIWWEACAVVPEGRANPQQMMLTKQNRDGFSRLLEDLRSTALRSGGNQTIHILQLTHSGRYARPEGHKPMPMIAQHDSLLDIPVGLNENDPVVSDAYLDRLLDYYVESAKLAKECGYDGVDIKACHRYLLNELLCARNRAGKYGGSFENRIRLMIDIIKAVRSETGNDFIVASRFNAFDAHPNGFGCSESDCNIWDETEPIALTKALIDAGADLLSASAGNPYYKTPNVTRPFDLPAEGASYPDEHPLQSVARLIHLTGAIQSAAGNIPVIGTGYTWLRQFIPNAAAANIAAGACSMVGLGRSSIAYPSAPYDLFRDGCFHSEKCCVTCSKCTQMMRDHGEAGCVLRDSAEFLPKYRKYREEAIIRSSDNAK